MFNSIAESYDSLNHIMSMDIDKSWRRKAIRKIGEGLEMPSRAGQDGCVNFSLLDLACGTGDFSITAAKHIKGLKVTGVDLSEGMLEVMKRKVEDAGLQDRVQMSVGDGENLPFPDNSFDRVSIAFGIRNFENREKGLREMLRVLKPSGRLVILELSVPESPVVRGLYKGYFTKFMPWLGGKISGNRKAYNYLPASVISFPKKDEFMRTMRQCGFEAVGHRALSLGICRMYWGTKQAL